jgi:hypothetical protein
VQERARNAHALFEQDMQHPSLNFKRVRGTHSPIYSARIGVYYRALGLLEGDVVTWFWIGPHTEYERLIGRL